MKAACATQNPGYLVQTPHSWYFRFVVPFPLRCVVGKTEIRYSLKTGSVGVAKRKARFLAGQVQRVFLLLEMEGERMKEQLTQDQIRQLVADFIKKAVAEMDMVFSDQRDEWDRPYQDAQGLRSYNSDLSGFREDLITNLNLGDFSMLESSINAFLLANGIEKIDKTSPAYHQLCVEIHKAQATLISIEQQHRRCDFSYRDHLPTLFPGVFAPAPAPEVKERTREEEPKKDKPKPVAIEKIFKDYWREAITRLKKRTLTEYESSLNRFLDYVGRKTNIHSIDSDVIRKYKELLLTEKGGSSKIRQSQTIQGKYLGVLRTFFKHAVDNGFIKESPVGGISVKGKRTMPHEQQDPFTDAELKKMFCESKGYREDALDKAWQFWIPILALYTGMRLEEICQLYISDVKTEEGFWGLNIIEDESKPDKSVKTSSGKRFVPLHPFVLEELGFVRFVDRLPDREGRVFPDLKRTNNRYGNYASIWFTAFRKECGIEAPPRRKTFHSLRHTVSNFLLQRGAYPLAVSALLGHALRGETAGRYKGTHNPDKVLEQAVLKLDYDLDLSHLKNSRWVVPKEASPDDGTI
jgi:integrase